MRNLEVKLNAQVLGEIMKTQIQKLIKNPLQIQKVFPA